MTQKSRITVLRVIDRLNIGGPAIHAVLTTKGLDPERFQTILVTGNIEPGEGDMAYLLQDYDVKSVTTIPTLGRELRPLEDLRAAWALYKIIRRERPQVVHTHKAKAGVIGRLVALAAGTPVRVHTFHGHVLQGYFGPVRSAFFATIERALARISSQLITPSERLADDLAEVHHICAREKFRVVPLGFDLARFESCELCRGRLRAELKVGHGIKLVGIIGRMVPVKAHDVFVAAAQQVARRRDDVHFVFVGGGQLEGAIRADVARRGLTARSHFLGWRRDLPEIYADLDVAALSSINEGTPVSLIEAISSGVPVVATNVGGVSDVLRNGARGVLVPANDPEALADGIERALQPEARERAAVIRPQMREYASDRLCRDLGQLYIDLLNSAANGRAGTPVMSISTAPSITVETPIRKPKVVHVITRLIAGGAQENTILSCAGLRDRYDILLVTGPPEGREGSLIEDAAHRGVRVQVMPELVRPIKLGSDAAAFRQLLKLFQEERPDIVHTHSSKAGIVGRSAAFCARVPVIVHTNHGLPYYDFQSLARRGLYWSMEKAATAVTHKVVCVGEEMKRKSIAGHLGPPELFEVIYSGIEIERFLQARSARERLGISPDAKVVGVVSRMANHKGHRFCVEAAPPDVHLLMVGDGEARADLEKQVAERGIQATFVGHVPPDDVPDLIASMDLIVHPSLWEGLPRAAVQGLLVGRPVVAFDCDGAREVVIDGLTGKLVPPKSIEGLRQAIEDILALPDRGRSMGQEGRRRCSERFDWRRCADQLDVVYREVLERRTGSLRA
jgi:glycosyltransferase involved in cell wall biosynthesis